MQKELRVQRLRVVEPDGTTRMIIGNSTMSSIMPMRGKELRQPGRGSWGGILFCNDEGTEAGGLIYAGGVIDGEPSQFGFRTVDDFEQNEGLRLGASQDGRTRTQWIEFADQPYTSLVDFSLRDAYGAERIRLCVAADAPLETHSTAHSSRNRRRNHRDVPGVSKATRGAEA